MSSLFLCWQRSRRRERLGPHHPPGGLGPRRSLSLLCGGHVRPGRAAPRTRQPGGPRLPQQGGGGGGSGRHGRPDEGVCLEPAQVWPGGAGIRACCPSQDGPALHMPARVCTQAFT